MVVAGTSQVSYQRLFLAKYALNFIFADKMTKKVNGVEPVQMYTRIYFTIAIIKL